MKFKRVLVGAGLLAAVGVGAFAAGSLNQSTTSAQVTGRTGAPTLAAQQSASTVKVQSWAATNQAVRNVAQQAQAQPSQTPQPTEVAGTPEPTEAAGTPEPTEAAGQDTDNVQQGDQSGPDTGGVTGAQNGQETPDNEAADAQALASQASITQQQAEQAALAANPGTSVVKTDLGDENGTVVYDVELNNGSDVKVNAQTGAIIGTDSGNDTGTDNGN